MAGRDQKRDEGSERTNRAAGLAGWITHARPPCGQTRGPGGRSAPFRRYIRLLRTSAKFFWGLANVIPWPWVCQGVRECCALGLRCCDGWVGGEEQNHPVRILRTPPGNALVAEALVQRDESAYGRSS